MRDADHHRHALVGELDGAADQVLALGEAEVSVFLGLDAGSDHHGGAAVLDHVVDLAGEAGFVDLEVGGEGGQRRNDQSRCLSKYRPRCLHGVLRTFSQQLISRRPSHCYRGSA